MGIQCCWRTLPEGGLREAKEDQPKERPALLTVTPPSKLRAQKRADCSLWAQQAQIFKFYEDIPALTMILKFNACALLS